jgi:hypothetical protein
MAGLIANFGFAAVSANVYSRHGDVFVKDDVGGTNWHTLGHIESLTINAEPVSQGMDTHKREFQVAVMVTVEFTMKQTDYATEIANLDALAVPVTNGHNIKITDCGVTGVDQPTLNTNVDAAAGVEFTGAQPQVGLQLDFGGETSLIPVSFSGQIPLSEFIKIGNSAVSLLTC